MRRLSGIFWDVLKPRGKSRRQESKGAAGRIGPSDLVPEGARLPPKLPRPPWRVPTNAPVAAETCETPAGFPQCRLALGTGRCIGSWTRPAPVCRVHAQGGRVL